MQSIKSIVPEALSVCALPGAASATMSLQMLQRGKGLYLGTVCIESYPAAC